MYDFNWKQDTRYNRKCPHSYDYVIDIETTEVSDICGGGPERVKQIFMSEGNVVQIGFKEEMLKDKMFLIEFNGTLHNYILPILIHIIIEDYYKLLLPRLKCFIYVSMLFTCNMNLLIMMLINIGYSYRY